MVLSGSIEEWYRIDSGWACAAVIAVDGVIVKTAPIFRRLIGQTIRQISESNYRVEKLREEKET